MSGKSIAEAVACREVKPNIFESKNNVGFNGGLDGRIGYGGWVIAFGVNAAAATVKTGYHVYSVTGYFLGPSFTATTLKATVSSIRDTKTFATRRIELVQTIAGKERNVMFMVVDFQMPEPATLLEYSAAPLYDYTLPERSQTWEDKCRIARERGVSEKVVKAFTRRFATATDFFEIRSAPEGVTAYNLLGMTPTWPSPFDKIPMPKRTTCEYYRALVPSSSHLDNVLSLCYVADAGMPYIPPAMGKVSPKEIGAAGSLEFALRIFANKLDVSQWVTREEQTMVGGDGRTYVEARMWDSEGKMIASMTEQCILRPGKARI